MQKWVALLFIALGASASFAATKRVQICASACATQTCKKLAEEVEFEFEMSEQFLLPRCTNSKSPLPKKEFRLVFSQEATSEEILVELGCDGKQKCLSKSYPAIVKKGGIVAKVVSDVKLAIKHNKVISPKISPPLEKKNPPTPFSKGGTIEEEWDRVILVSPAEKKPEPSIVTEVPAVEPAIERKNPLMGSVMMSIGGENWNYSFDSDANNELVQPFHSRIYPKLLFTASYWPLPYLRLATQLGASVVTFRLKANQPVDGDGQLIFGHKYESDFLVGYMQAIGDVVHVGADVGYEFAGAFVDSQRVAERNVTIVPGYYNHAVRLGPRIIIGQNSDRGLLDIGVGLYPFVAYAETPDEPASHKKAFAWSVQGRARLMLRPDVFVDASVNSESLYVRYDQEPLRETVNGEKWGTGRVVSVSSSATLGLGLLF